MIGPLLLIAAAAAGAAQDFAQAQPRLEEFGGPAAGGEEPRREACTADRRWCARLVRDGETGPWRLQVGDRELALAGAEPDGTGGEEVSLWPQIVTSPGGSALIGVERLRRAGYSGGGASATMVKLIEAPARNGPLREVLEVPISGGAMIRACFDERDRRRRRQVCHDEYGFEGTLRLGPHAPGTLPSLILTTAAQTSPGRRSRSDGNDGPVGRGQTGPWRDPVCSYRRTFTFDGASGRYRPDRPLPACADYLEP